MKRTYFLISLPLLVLLAWVILLGIGRLTNPKVILPVTGFDPRDILAGQYLNLRTDYGKVECPDKRNYNTYICPETRVVYAEMPPADICPVFIEGSCYGNRFNDRVSRFYIPEGEAVLLESAIRNAANKPEILLSVSKEGLALPLDLIIDGKPWKEWIENAK